MFIFNKIKLGPFLPRVMLYELILINEIEQRAKFIFLSVEYLVCLFIYLFIYMALALCVNSSKQQTMKIHTSSHNTPAALL